MKKVIKYSKILMLLLDIVIIAVSATVANLLLTEKTIIFSKENITTILNSILISIAVYEIYLNFFKVYKHITRFENGKDYLVYILSCFVSGVTLIIIKVLFNIDINSVRKQILEAFITSVGIIGSRVVIRFL